MSTDAPNGLHPIHNTIRERLNEDERSELVQELRTRVKAMMRSESISSTATSAVAIMIEDEFRHDWDC